MSSASNNVKKNEVVSPIGDRVLIRRDAHKSQTKAGIHLPDNVKIPTLTGRIMEISAKVEANSDYSDLRRYQRVLFNPSRQVPIDFEQGENPLVVVPVEDVVAVINQEDPDGAVPTTQGRSGSDMD